jgi:hypothetical protein
MPANMNINISTFGFGEIFLNLLGKNVHFTFDVSQYNIFLDLAFNLTVPDPLPYC